MPTTHAPPTAGGDPDRRSDPAADSGGPAFLPAVLLGVSIHRMRAGDPTPNRRQSDAVQARVDDTKKTVDNIPGRSHQQQSCDHSIVGGVAVTGDPDSTPEFPKAPRVERNRRAIPTSVCGETVSDLSVMLGAFSIVTYWAFGVGIVLGVAAVVAAVCAAITTVTGERANRRPVTMRVPRWAAVPASSASSRAGTPLHHMNATDDHCSPVNNSQPRHRW